MDLSVIIPIYNERENIAPLLSELREVLGATRYEYEVILVDDGSNDGSAEVLAAEQPSDPHLVVVRLTRNYGQTAALAAGLRQSRGAVVVPMDGDLQNDPRDIPPMLERLAGGYDLVAGHRQQRRDKWWSRRLPSIVANWVIGWVTGVRLHDYGCTLKAIRGDMARSLRLYGEMHRFIPALVDDLGGHVTEYVVHHRPRRAGVSKYGISRTIRVILDLATVKFLSTYSTRPIHVFGVLGLAATGIGLALLAFLGFERIYLGIELGGRPIVLLAIFLAIMGIQFVTMGLLGELLVRTYHESQDKAIYRIAEVRGGAVH